MASQPPSNRELYLRLLGYVKPYWKMFAIAILTMMATASTAPLFPALMKPLLDVGFGGKDGNHVLLPVMIVGIFLLRGVIGFVSDYTMSWVANKVVLDLRAAMFARMVCLPTRFFDDRSSGALMS